MILPNTEQQEAEEVKKRRLLEIQNQLDRRRRAIENIYKSSDKPGVTSNRTKRLAYIKNIINDEIGQLHAQLVEISNDK